MEFFEDMSAGAGLGRDARRALASAGVSRPAAPVKRLGGRPMEPSARDPQPSSASEAPRVLPTVPPDRAEDETVAPSPAPPGQTRTVPPAPPTRGDRTGPPVP